MNINNVNLFTKKIKHLLEDLNSRQTKNVYGKTN